MSAIRYQGKADRMSAIRYQAAMPEGQARSILFLG
jgi:hypothetical protein